MIRAIAYLILLMGSASASAEELRGRLAAWSGGTGRGEFVVIGESQRYVVGYVEPLKREGWDPHKRIEAGFWVRVPTRAPSADDDELFMAERLIVIGVADPWITEVRQYVDDLFNAIFVSGDSRRVQNLVGRRRSDVEHTLSWFMEHRRPRIMRESVRNLQGWIFEQIRSDRLTVLSAPELCRPLASLNLEFKRSGPEIVLEHAARVDPVRYDRVFKDDP